jgi:hypothetical protein
MTFTRQELFAIIAMCRHETDLLRQIEAMIPGIKINQALAHASSIALRADLMLDAIAKEEHAPTKEGSK